MPARATSFLPRAMLLAGAVGLVAPSPAAFGVSRVLHSNQEFSIAHTNQEDGSAMALRGVSDVAPAWWPHLSTAPDDWTAPPGWFVTASGPTPQTVVDGLGGLRHARGSDPTTGGHRHGNNVISVSSARGAPGLVVPAPGAVSLIGLMLALGHRRRRRCGWSVART